VIAGALILKPASDLSDRRNPALEACPPYTARLLRRNARAARPPRHNMIPTQRKGRPGASLCKPLPVRSITPPYLASWLMRVVRFTDRRRPERASGGRGAQGECFTASILDFSLHKRRGPQGDTQCSSSKVLIDDPTPTAYHVRQNDLAQRHDRIAMAACHPAGHHLVVQRRSGCSIPSGLRDWICRHRALGAAGPI